MISDEEAKQWLRKYLGEKDENQADQILEKLLCDYAEPIIKAVVRHSKLWVNVLRPHYDEGDILGYVWGALIEKFLEWREKPQNARLDNLRGFIVRTTLNILVLRWREIFPKCRRFYDKLRYLLEGRGRVKIFALWDGKVPGEELCGFLEWKGHPRCHSELYGLWCTDPHRFAAEALPYGSDPQKMDLPQLLVYIFNWVGGPMEFDDLLAGLLELLDIQDTITYVDLYELESAAPPIDPEESDQGKWVARLTWEGLKRLPVNQRRALLLHQEHKDLEPLIDLLFYYGYTLKELANLLEISLSELKDLIPRLPLKDKELAQMMGLTKPQQVINLRVSALRSLWRWLGDHDVDRVRKIKI